MFMDLFYPTLKMGASSNWGTACMAGYIQLFNLIFYQQFSEYIIINAK
jgi:hypothetical protein